MRILLDCDGILSDFHAMYLPVVEKFTGISLTQNDCHTFDVLKQIGREDKNQQINEYIEWNELCLKIPVLPGVKEALAKLQRLHEVVIVTAPMSTKTWCDERRRWLKEHFDIPKSKIVFTSGKHYVSGNVFVDDSLDNCIKWANHQIGKVYLWNRPWNQKGKQMGRVKVVDCWEELLKDLNE